METPLSPLEFMRRARRLYADREAVVDGDLRWTYAQFFERCDRWSVGAAGARRAARATAWPTSRPTRTPSSTRSTPCRRSAPSSCRSTTGWRADEFAYIIQHSGATVVCVDDDYLEVVDAAARPNCRACATSWRSRARATAGSTTRRSWRRRRRRRARPPRRRDRPADHQLHERHDLAPEGRDDHAPQRLRERRRHARPHAT